MRGVYTMPFRAAQMFQRVGVPTTVVTMPSSVYFSRANRLEFSLMLVGWGTDTGEPAASLKALLATYDRDKGLGTANRGRYSSAKMDQLLGQGLPVLPLPPLDLATLDPSLAGLGLRLQAARALRLGRYQFLTADLAAGP